ncbi:MAG: transposase [Akkermansiaceae bacterium]|nr:transposase [Akkermansiaceae bacterium]
MSSDESSCHQRRVRGTSAWIAGSVCHAVPHRQFVFTIPRVLRGIFRKRRRLLTHLFHTAASTLRDSFRARLDLPEGRIGAIAAVHTFGDYLIFHPHLHILAADGLFAPDGSFHCMPQESMATAVELFRHRFLHTLHENRLISAKKLGLLLAWKHSGFNIDNGGEEIIAPDDTAGRERLAQYLLRHPFSLQKITWNATTKTVIYRSKRHHSIKRNFQIFKAPDFIAAALDHLPPKGQQTVRYYGVYSNKSRGIKRPAHPDIHACKKHAQKPETIAAAIRDKPVQILLIPAPPKHSARDMRPLWRDLILKVWGGDPLQCPCCKGTMKPVRTHLHPGEIEFFLRLYGLWEGVIKLPRPPPPPFDIETMDPIEPPWKAVKEWIPDQNPELDWFNRPRIPSAPPGHRNAYDQRPRWKPEEVPLGDGRTLVLDPG